MTVPTWLVAFDDTTCARAALAEACRAMRMVEGRVVLTYALPDSGDSGLPLGAAMVPLPAVPTEPVHKHFQAVLDRAANEARESFGVPIETAIRIGPVADAIAEGAEEENAELVVVGTHGRKGVLRLVLGSAAERIARDAPCPVLVVKEREVERSAFPAKHVVAAIALASDGDPVDLATAETAVRIARRFGGQVTLLHVMSPAHLPVIGADADPQARAAVARMRGDLEGVMLKRFEALRAALDDGGVAVDTQLIGDAEGVPAGVARFADDFDADLVVTTEHRKPALRRALGSVALRVLRRAPCSVVIARAPAPPDPS